MKAVLYKVNQIRKFLHCVPKYADTHPTQRSENIWNFKCIHSKCVIKFRSTIFSSMWYLFNSTSQFYQLYTLEVVAKGVVVSFIPFYHLLLFTHITFIKVALTVYCIMELLSNFVPNTFLCVLCFV